MPHLLYCFPHKWGYDTVADFQRQFKKVIAVHRITVVSAAGTNVRTMGAEGWDCSAVSVFCYDLFCLTQTLIMGHIPVSAQILGDCLLACGIERVYLVG
jgi:hypothetical protein